MHTHPQLGIPSSDLRAGSKPQSGPLGSPHQVWGDEAWVCSRVRPHCQGCVYRQGGGCPSIY